MNCNFGFSNTGVCCTPNGKVIKKIFLVPYYNSAMVINAILKSAAPYTSAFFTALRDNADPSVRWYPLPVVEEATNKRLPSLMKTYKSGRKSIIHQGLREFSMIITGEDASPGLAARLKGMRSSEMGMYILDIDNNIWGMNNGESPAQLDPLHIDRKSFDAIYNPGDDENEAEILVTGSLFIAEVDDNMQAIAGSDLDPTAQGSFLATLNGLLDVTAVISAITTSTTATFDIELDLTDGCGSFLTTVTEKGAGKINGVASPNNFVSPNSGAVGKVYDATAAADVAVTSVTEQLDGTGRPTGKYVVVLGANIAAGHKVSVGISRSGFDHSSIPAQGGTGPNYTFVSV